jgi:divalent metal cation (Fe/Co/Zn/Cd) transporter
MDLIGLLVTVIILGIIFYVLWWGLGKMALPEPFNKVAVAILVLIIVLVLLGLLTGHVNIPMFRTR